jgi:hypothetical protein
MFFQDTFSHNYTGLPVVFNLRNMSLGGGSYFDITVSNFSYLKVALWDSVPRAQLWYPEDLLYKSLWDYVLQAQLY